MDGLLIVDKPSGPTSHDVVARVRRATGERRIGHTGTLDPAASGVLPLVLGRATRLARFVSDGEKSYDASIRLGIATDTCDAQGVPLGPPYDGQLPSATAIEQALGAFRGTFPQQPPRYSAKKVEGQRSYRLARAAQRGNPPDSPAALSVLPAPATVTAYAIELLGVTGDTVTLRVECSPGFYVRSLAHDLGVRLGVGAHLSALRRTRSGDASIADALSLEALEREPARGLRGLVPVARMLGRLPSVVLTADGVNRARNGRELNAECVIGSGVAQGEGRHPFFRLLNSDGDLVGIGEPSSTGGLLHPSVILV